MRSSRIAALAATGALAAVTVLGGAGIAQAQSSDLLPAGSLGSSDAKAAPSVSLSIEKADKAGANGAIQFNNFEEAPECEVFVSNFDLVKGVEAYLGKNVDKVVDDALKSEELKTAAAKADTDKQTLEDVKATVSSDKKSATWTGVFPTDAKPAADYRAGAAAVCTYKDGTATKTLTAFAYEGPSSIGEYFSDFVDAIDVFGSLGSAS